MELDDIDDIHLVHLIAGDLMHLDKYTLCAVAAAHIYEILLFYHKDELSSEDVRDLLERAQDLEDRVDKIMQRSKE